MQSPPRHPPAQEHRILSMLGTEYIVTHGVDKRRNKCVYLRYKSTDLTLKD